MAGRNSCFHLLMLLFLLLLTKTLFLEALLKSNSSAENSNMGCIEMEKQTLLQFKEGLKDPSGRLSSWDVRDDCCKWVGVGCDSKTSHVSRLDLRGQYDYVMLEVGRGVYNISALSGTLNPSLLNLTYLNYLDLSNNDFQGIPIPEFIGSLRNLRYLNLSRMIITGIVPPNLGNLSNLQYLDLSWNIFSVRHPLWVLDLNWLSSLSSLEYLDLGGLDLHNASTDWLQVLNTLPSLKELHLSSCELSNFPQSVPFLNFTSLLVLDLSSNYFHQIPIPSYISSLKNLRYLDLSFASFSEMLPPSLGNLSYLQYLNLDSFSYSYKLKNSDFNWLSGLSSLQYLCLNNVNLNMTTTDWLPVVNMVPTLRELHLYFCGLLNSHHSLPVVNFTSLSVLDLSFNSFSSPIPQWLFNISTLTTISLYGCELSGSIPRFMPENLSNLRHLDLSGNDISGEITEFIEALSRCNNNTLQSLSLSSNKLRGNLPVSLGRFKYLERLDLGSNAFIGALPTSISNLSHLEVLDLEFNEMNGTISENIGQLTRLRYLGLCGNSWKGVVTENHLQNLSRLDEFYLSSKDKHLVFNMRDDWIAPFSLHAIEIIDCQLGPAFPSWLKTQTDVESLLLSNVAISDSIPNWLWRSPRLTMLDLSINQLRGELPKAINLGFNASILLAFNRFEGSLPVWPNVTILSLRNNLISGPIPVNIGHKMSVLEYLDLSGNLLNGCIPASMGEIRTLSLLDLSNNSLSGEIPSNWHNLQGLMDIDLSRNNLSGGIPRSICSLASLIRLKLRSNNLSDELSVSLSDCKGLSSLDLGENKFHGTIQPIAGNLFNLSYLGLRSNRLTGNIPKILCRFPNLHVLDLAHNHLSGYIPKCLGNLQALKFMGTRYTSPLPIPNSILFSMPMSLTFIMQLIFYFEHVEVIFKGRMSEFTRTFRLLNAIDLSSNNLTGEIPIEITNLSVLNTLNLSWNQLTGKMPDNIQCLQQLETLDLSSNNLSGPIPPSMSSMTLLNHLNLSHNNLSGPIPTANQFGTFNDPSIYKSNPYLCGPPLTASCSSGLTDTKHKTDEVEGENGSEKFWLFVGMALGFIVGFWVVCGSLIVKRSWRHAYFRLVDKTKDKLLVVIEVHLARLRRKVARKMLEDASVPQWE